MLYDKKVKYLSFYESGEKIGNCGFVRLEQNNKSVHYQMVIQNAGYSGQLLARIYFLTEKEKREGAMLALKGGYGEAAGNLSVENGLFEVEFGGILIALDENREIKCIWRKTVIPQIGREEKKQAEAVGHREREEQIEITERMEREEPIEIMERMEREEPIEITERVEREGQIEITERVKRKEQSQVTEHEEKEGQNEIEEPDQTIEQLHENPRVRIADSKWEQLWSIYPHVRPFQDEREYLSVGLSDFVLLQDKSYQIANNSFLLHGYYSYGHLILCRMNRNGKENIYIGVPGIFHEKEVQVAILFGFVSFEGQKEPAQQDAFGYYMLPVDI